jgi:hypothetical protein
VDTDRRFKGPCCLYHQGDRAAVVSKSETSLPIITHELSDILLRIREIPSSNLGPEKGHLIIYRGLLNPSKYGITTLKQISSFYILSNLSSTNFPMIRRYINSAVEICR